MSSAEDAPASSPSPSPRRAIGDWLDERIGHRALLAWALDEPVRGGARWAYVWGSTLLFVLANQIVTGLLLASDYAPSSTTAWASVAYIQDEVTLGWFIRGMHAAGASAMVILLGLHLLQVTLYGAYRRPREVNWILGVVLLGLTLGFALTGYLLPWDQKGYWATQVATSLAGASPLVGHALQTLLQGGEAYGNLTLTRFFTLHVFVLPSLVVLLVVAHVAVFRKHGVTPPVGLDAKTLDARTVTFWPTQLLRDTAAIAVVAGLMALSVLRSHGADLEAPADPTAAYDARPEWYFLPLFQLLKLFPGRLEVPAALGAPLVVFGALLALPFLDKGADASLRARKLYVGVVGLIVLGAVALGVQATVQDAHNAAYRKQREKARIDAERARTLARKGVPPVGGTAVWENDPAFAAEREFGGRCAGCHELHGAGERKAPALDGWGSREYLGAFLKNPDAPRFFGATALVGGMKPVAASDEEVRALVEYVYSLGAQAAGGERQGEGGGDKVDASLAERGKQLFTDKDCDECHETDGKTEGQGPNLAAWGSPSYVAAVIRDAGAPTLFRAKNKMTRFDGKIPSDGIDALAHLVAGQRFAASPAPSGSSPR